MINDTPHRCELSRRLTGVQNELDDLGDNHMDLLPYELVCRFHRLTKEFRAFVASIGHDHD